MVKLISKFAEEGRVHIRQVRHDALKHLKGQETDGHVSEDETKRLSGEIQKLHDRYIAQVDELLKKKTAEVMEV
jgi:ribosome recycling factor